MTTVVEIAKLIDHSLLQPTLTDEELRAGCELAKRLNVAAVCIKPYAVQLAAELLAGSQVNVCTVVGFPHGNSTVAVKVFETEQACRAGAAEIDMVVNIGKVLGEDWNYITDEIDAVHQAALRNHAIVKVIFENDFLPSDKYKVKLCEICSRLKVEYVKTSTGYGFVKGSDGRYSYAGATEHDLELMRRHSAPQVQVKAAGGVRTLDELLRARALGATRIGASATEQILNDAQRRFEQGSL